MPDIRVLGMLVFPSNELMKDGMNEKMNKINEEINE